MSELHWNRGLYACRSNLSYSATLQLLSILILILTTSTIRLSGWYEATANFMSVMMVVVMMMKLSP